MNRFTILILPLVMLVPTGTTSVSAQSSERLRDQRVEAVLVSEVTSIRPGEPFRVGLLLDHDPGWHTYWKSSATGYATSIQWDLPEGFSAGPIEWPVPEVYTFQDWIEYVYSGEVLLVVTITPPGELEPGTVDLRFAADWLMCEQVCIPGGIQSVLSLPVMNAPPATSRTWAEAFARHERSSPEASGEWSLSAWQEPSGTLLMLAGQDLPAEGIFFDETGAFNPASGLQPVSRDESSLRWRLIPQDASVPVERIGGVIGFGRADGGKPLLVDVTVGEPAAPVDPESSSSLAGILLLAFVGGLILNLMPCVFPVLGIKIMGFVGQSGESRKKVVGHGLVFSLGVLLSFWTLAIVLVLLRSGGAQLGWGFQLQSPGFVLALTLLLFAFGLNMSGLFEVGQSAIGVGSSLTARSGLAGSFFSGVLATVVATPCAAPFLAPALGAALTLPIAASLLVFTFIAIGLALPYLVLSSFPVLINRLPRPGPWMETFKQAMSFLLYATVAYLLWVLAGQLTDAGGYGGFALLKVLLSLVILAIALWIYGRWAAYHRPRRVRLTGLLAAGLLAIGSVVLGLSGTQPTTGDAEALQWEKWEPGKGAQLAAQGQVVYVDFTARWCVTCQTNKAAVFSSDKVRQLIRDKKVVLLKADWTNRDERISRRLSEFGRSAVPFNLVFGPALDEPLVLPELLTPGIVIEALEAAHGEVLQ